MQLNGESMNGKPDHWAKVSELNHDEINKRVEFEYDFYDNLANELSANKAFIPPAELLFNILMSFNDRILKNNSGAQRLVGQFFSNPYLVSRVNLTKILEDKALRGDVYSVSILTDLEKVIRKGPRLENGCPGGACE